MSRLTIQHIVRIVLISMLVMIHGHADVIIGPSINNGGFVSVATDFNGSPDNWTSTSGVWIASGNTTLNSPPFGADTATNSRFIQIHKDAGDVLTSTAKFSVAAGDAITLNFDYRISGSGNNTNLTITLWDALNNTTYATLGTINTATAVPSFITTTYQTTASTANANLYLRFTLSSAGGLGKDFNIDRVYLTGGTIALPLPIVYQTLQQILPDDTAARIVEKAAKTLPRPNQVAWQRMETTFFIHFGVNTFNGVEWGTGTENPNLFNPTAFNADQWVREIKDAGGKMVILVVKHHDGFCLWPSRYTAHDVGSSTWLGGSGDVLRSVADACHARGLKLGIYLSPADLFQIHARDTAGYTEGYYGNGSAAVNSVIPTDPASFKTNPSNGRTPPTGKSSVTVVVDDYNRYFYNQLYELLTEYGTIDEMWFDGANPESGYTENYDYPGWYDLIHQLQPNAVISIGGPDVRWVGNEGGVARTDEWSVIPFSSNPNNGGGRPDATLSDLGSRSKLTVGSYLWWFPAECDVPLLNGWFWNSSKTPKSVSSLLGIYYTSVGRNSNLLLNLSPDTRGLIPDNQLANLRSFSQIVRNTMSQDLASGSTITVPTDSLRPAINLHDGNLNTFWEAADNATTADLILDLPTSRVIDVVSLQEPIADRSQRIEGFSIDTWDGTTWTTRATGTTVGYKRLLKLSSAITTDRVRIRITASRMNPSLAEVGLYKEAIAIAAPTISNRDGSAQITLTGTTGLTMRYTLDGTIPTAISAIYTTPIAIPLGATVNAACFGNDGLPGVIATKEFPNLSPTSWTLTADSQANATTNAAAKAMDDNPTTYWTSGSSALPHSLTIDMGETRCLGGITYLPVSGGGNGTIKRYRVETSSDNNSWSIAAEGSFGNIAFNPVLQSVSITPVVARYVRFTALEEINGNATVSVAEFGLTPAGFDLWCRERALQSLAPPSDPDGNGYSTLLEYAAAIEPGNTAKTALITATSQPNNSLRIHVRRRTSLPDLNETLEQSSDLVTWQTLSNPPVMSEISNDDGSVTREYAPSTSPTNRHSFYRMAWSRK